MNPAAVVSSSLLSFLFLILLWRAYYKYNNTPRTTHNSEVLQHYYTTFASTQHSCAAQDTLTNSDFARNKYDDDIQQAARTQKYLSPHRREKTW